MDGSRRLPLLFRLDFLGDLRSLDDRECARPLLSRSANAFVGDFKVLGMPASSIVFVRVRDVFGVRVRLRMVMP